MILAPKTDSRQRLAQAAVITACGLLLAALPLAMRLREALKQASTMRTTYAVKEKMLRHKGALLARVERAEEQLAKVEASLVSDRGRGEFAQMVVRTARAANCSVQTVRPLPPITVPRLDAKGERARAGGGDRTSRFMRWPVSLSLLGQFASQVAFLKGLMAQERSLQITRLKLGPTGADGKILLCEVEVSAYGLDERAEEGLPR